MVKHVILWSAPRCVSTAFERSIETLKNCQVLHEPFSSPYYFGPERQSSQFASTPIDAKATYDGAADILQAHYPGKELVFAKDLAYYTDGKLFRRGLDRFTHTFIIRRPERAVYSLFKMAEKDGDEWGEFDPKEAGFREIHNLYTFVKEKLGYTPVVVDADDLLADPEGMMKAHCSAVGIPYEENMTKWEPRPNFSDWRERGHIFSMHWKAELIQSSGIIKCTKKSTVDLPQDLPREVSQTIAECKHFYLAMHSVRLLPAPEN